MKELIRVSTGVFAALLMAPARCMAEPDADGDGVRDATDNCTLVANEDQRETNDDGYGNRSMSVSVSAIPNTVAIART